MEFSQEQVPEVAQAVVAAAKRSFAAATGTHATLITFSGDLGAGKTTLIQAIAKQLGITEDLQSPTYVIYKRYTIHGHDTWQHLIHGDMYRLESADEILKLGWNELLADPTNILLIEWPEKIALAIPEWAIWVKLRYGGEEKRFIDIN